MCYAPQYKSRRDAVVVASDGSLLGPGLIGCLLYTYRFVHSFHRRSPRRGLPGTTGAETLGVPSIQLQKLVDTLSL